MVKLWIYQCTKFVTSVTEAKKNVDAQSFEIAENVERFIVKIMDNFEEMVDHNNLCDDAKTFVSNHLHMSLFEAKCMENKTINQSECATWFVERKKRITASNFGAVINRRKSVFPTSLLKKLLGKNKLFTLESTQWGKDHEQVAIAKYESENKIKVSRCGFIINTKWPWLGCSPDGIYSYVKSNRNKMSLFEKRYDH